MNHRPERVSGLLIEALSKLILKEVEVPGALITITAAEITKDLSQAFIKVSVYPTEKSEEVLKVLQKMQRGFQYTLVRQLNIKPMPQLNFKIDYGMERAAGVEKALLEDGEK